MSRLTGEAWLGSKQKRTMDLAIAGGLLPLVSVPVLVTAGIISATEREVPFITQRRLGKGGQLFTIAKLRTMPHGTEETMSNGHYDSRRTPLGRILSASRLDETPQLWNVLTGSMSMVGLRPLVRTHHEQFMDSLDSKTRNSVAHAYDVAPAGWFDPYGVDLYVHGVTDTHEARAESILRYTHEASLRRDTQIMLQALGIVKHLVGESEATLLPLENPPHVPVEE